MGLPAFQDASFDCQGNPGIKIAGCPNCGKIPAAFRGERYLTVVGHAALSNSGQQHPNDPCSRACRLQWEHAERTPTIDPWFAVLEPDEAYAAVENHLLPLLREVQEMGYGSAEFRQVLEDTIGPKPSDAA